MDKLETLVPGQVGSKVVQFLSLKDATSLAKCSRRCKAIVEHPFSTPPMVTISKYAMFRSTRDRVNRTLNSVLNRPYLQGLTFDIVNGNGWGGSIFSFVALLKDLNITKLTILCDLCPERICSHLLKNLNPWLPQLETLAIVYHHPFPGDDVWDLDYKTYHNSTLTKLHTLDLGEFETFGKLCKGMSGIADMPHLHTVSVFLHESDFTNHDVAATLSKMAPSRLTIRSDVKDVSKYDALFTMLQGRIVESLESLGETNVWSRVAIDKFPNLREVRSTRLTSRQIAVGVDRAEFSNVHIPDRVEVMFE